MGKRAPSYCGMGLWAAALATGATGSVAQGFDDRPHLNFYGVTGIVDMPNAASQPDGQFSLTTSYFGGSLRNTLTFQPFPRVEASFRYVGMFDLNYSGFQDYYDRSFDVSLRILDESRYLPAVRIGLQDFVGTGIHAAEYIAASKTLSPGLRVTGGLGWGRLGSHNSLGSPFGARPAPSITGPGGTLNADQWFRGPVAPFGGVEWQVNDDLTLMAEYSSDAYVAETGGGQFGMPTSAIMTRRSPFNFGMTYRLNKRTELGAYYLYGSEVGVRFSYSLNPYDPPENRVLPETAPQAVFPRAAPSEAPEIWTTDWVSIPDVEAPLFDQLQERLEPDGLMLESLTVEADRVEVRVRNGRYWSGAQAVGRTARALSWVMPASVETFRIVPVERGLAASAVVIRRSDLEALENAPDGATRLQAVAGLEDAGPVSPRAYRDPELFPRFEWSLSPYIKTSLFDPDKPLRYQLGGRVNASYEPAPGLLFSTAITQSVVGNIVDSTRVNNSALPPVRSNFVLYERGDQPAIEHLTANAFFRPGPNVYGRVSAGYLERMFGGVQAEILWKPVNSRLALGADVAWVKQRDYSDRFAFQNYDVVTGHVSAYYELGQGYEAQVDVGRYLAGDLGATFTFAREFNNGWRVGAFATFTDVSAQDFGEGSFDKGIFFEIPLAWLSGAPMQESFEQTIRPVQRDGGARLESEYRLYDMVDDYHGNGLDSSWGRVWR